MAFWIRTSDIEIAERIIDEQRRLLEIANEIIDEKECNCDYDYLCEYCKFTSKVEPLHRKAGTFMDRHGVS